MMACTLKGLPATWAPCSMTATLCAPTSDQGMLTLYADPAFARTAGTWRAHPDGPVHEQNSRQLHCLTSCATHCRRTLEVLRHCFAGIVGHGSGACRACMEHPPPGQVHPHKLPRADQLCGASSAKARSESPVWAAPLTVTDSAS